MRNVSGRSYRQNQDTFYVHELFSENRAVHEITWKNTVEHYRTRVCLVHAHFMLDTYGYKHALRTCNTYCRRRLSVTL